MKSAAITIVLNDERTKVLLVKRKDVPVFVLPGGGIEPFETNEAAAIRETFEETGLNVRIVRKTGEYSPINRLAALTHVYECLVVDGDFMLNDETSEIAFFAVADLPKSFFTVHRDFLHDALEEDVMVRKELTQVTYLNLLIYFFKHPVLVAYAILARFKNRE